MKTTIGEKIVYLGCVGVLGGLLGHAYYPRLPFWVGICVISIIGWMFY